MKILVHAIFYAPEPVGAAAYTAEMCEWLAARGHSVHVVCPPPYYPFWKVQPPYSAFAWRTETIAGVTVHRCPIWIPDRPRGLARLLYAFSFLLSSFAVMLFQALRRPDVVLVIEPSILNAFAALPAAAISGASSWLHVQDLEVDLAFSLRQLRANRLRAAVSAVESWILRRFDVVSSISGAMLDRLRQKGADVRQAVLFPNWVDTSSVYPVDAAPLRPRFGIPEDKIVALYSGSTGTKQGLDLLIAAARLLESDPRVFIVICGNNTSQLRNSAAGLTNVLFLPLQPRESLNDLLGAADIHLLPQRSAASDLVMPSKLLGMLASGRPVVATAPADSEIAKAVSRCGVVVAPEDAAGIASATLDLARDPARRRRLGSIARDLAVAACERETILTAFERELLSRVGERNAAELVLP